MEHERDSSRSGARSKKTWPNQTGRSGGWTLTGGSGRRAQAARSSRRVAEACVLHESRGSL
eukprot:9486754-Pyramimonas_sp.AAC.1